MASLRFSFGTMGSGKSTVALQIHHNLSNRQLYGLLLTTLDREGRQVTSRLGVAAPAIEVTPDLDIHALAVRYWPIHYIVCDEAQFYTAEQCDQLARVVDELDVDVYAFGLLTDFRGRLFDGTRRLLEIADEHTPLQVEARCWCGARATHNRAWSTATSSTRATPWSSATPTATRLRCSAIRSATNCSAGPTSVPATSGSEPGPANSTGRAADVTRCRPR